MFGFRERVNDNATNQFAVSCIENMLKEEPEIIPVENAWFTEKWIPSSLVGAPSRKGKGLEKAYFLAQEIALPITTLGHSDSRKLQKCLNAALKNTPTYKSFNQNDKKVLFHSLAHGESAGEGVRPIESLLGRIGFGMAFVEKKSADGGELQSYLILRLPDEIHCSASPDIKQCLQETLEQLALLSLGKETKSAHAK